ncbi:recombinase family protein [Kitasatospora sp. NPDC051853]|uniref:recombinase family protein n=1 Tax=Kitasatospora sp. NPDC051853 TaxID=3364058 RepID=UPI00379382B5
MARRKKTARKLEGVAAPTTPYDGCGKCFVGLRRLSRVSSDDPSDSPMKQADLTIRAVESIGGHIIAWADDWDISGDQDAVTRPELGPWLREENGPHDGLAGSSVERFGRSVQDGLNTEKLIRTTGRMLVTADHPGIWDLTDAVQEQEFTFRLMMAQTELRNIQKRNRDGAERAVEAHRVTGPPSYGYMHVRATPTALVERVIDTEAHTVLLEVVRRILSDTTGSVTVDGEVARLNRAGVMCPSDRLAVLYGREPEGGVWHRKTLAQILCGENALGLHMLKGRIQLSAETGRPVRIAPELWDRATHEALKAKIRPESRKLAPEVKATRRFSNRAVLLSALADCGNCGNGMVRGGSSRANGKYVPAYTCQGRRRGIPGSEMCTPAPIMAGPTADKIVETRFLARFGAGEIMRRVYDPGTNLASEIATLEAVKARLLADRAVGIYDEPEDFARFETQFKACTADIKALRSLPERPSGWITIPTGETVAERWAREDVQGRRELLIEHGVRVAIRPGRDSEARVTVTAEIADDPTAEVLGAVDGDPTRPEAPAVESAAATVPAERTSVRLAEPEGEVQGPPMLRIILPRPEEPEKTPAKRTRRKGVTLAA